MKHQIIAFVGMPGSGKGTCTEYLKSQFGYPVVHFGTMVYEETQRRGLKNVADEAFVREDMRAKEGMAVMAKHAAKKAEHYFKNGHSVVVFDGLYSWSEYKYLESLYGNQLAVIAVVAPKALRRERVMLRKDSHRTYTMPQLIEREISEIEHIEKGGPIAYADYTINNDSTLEQFINQLEHIISQIIKK